jgi:hypothetical protein
MDAVHDSVICVSCGRFGSSSDMRRRVECRDLYVVVADMWLNRPEKSCARGAREIAIG